MTLKTALRYTIALAAATPLLAFAGSFDAKPGAWEVTTTTLSQGLLIPPEVLANMPPEQRANIEKTMAARAGKPLAHTRKSCVTQQDLDQDRMIKDDNDVKCNQKIISKSPTRVVLERTCPPPDSLKMKMIVEVKNRESFTGSVDITQSGGGKVHGDIKGRWLGSSCAGIKDEN